MARSYSHGLALEEWEWNEERGRMGADPPMRSNTVPLDVPRAAPLHRSLSPGAIPASPTAGTAEEEEPQPIGGRPVRSDEELEELASSLSMDMTAAAMLAAERIRRVDEQQHDLLETRLSQRSMRSQSSLAKR